MSIEDIEMSKLRKSLDRDVEKLVDRYIENMEWDVIKIKDWDLPGIDEPKARRLILDEIKLAIPRLESQWSTESHTGA